MRDKRRITQHKTHWRWVSVGEHGYLMTDGIRTEGNALLNLCWNFPESKPDKSDEVIYLIYQGESMNCPKNWIVA